MAQNTPFLKICAFLIAVGACVVTIVALVNKQQHRIEEQVFYSDDGTQVRTFYREPMLYCYDGVVYVAPTSNRLAVKFNKDGSVATCDGP